MRKRTAEEKQNGFLARADAYCFHHRGRTPKIRRAHSSRLPLLFSKELLVLVKSGRLQMVVFILSRWLVLPPSFPRISLVLLSIRSRLSSSRLEIPFRFI